MDITRSDALNALAMAVLFGFVIALVATLFGNPAVGAGIAGAIGSFLGRLGFYASRNRKAMSGPKLHPDQR